MKLKNETIVYIYTAVLFILVYLFTSRLIKNVRAQEFDYLKLSINLVLLVVVLIKILKLGKAINDTLLRFALIQKGGISDPNTELTTSQLSSAFIYMTKMHGCSGKF